MRTFLAAKRFQIERWACTVVFVIMLVIIGWLVSLILEQYDVASYRYAPGEPDQLLAFAWLSMLMCFMIAPGYIAVQWIYRKFAAVAEREKASKNWRAFRR